MPVRAGYRKVAARKGLHIRLAMENRPQRRRRNAETHVLKAIRRFNGDGFTLIVTGQRHIEEPVAARTQALADPDARLLKRLETCRCRAGRQYVAQSFRHRRRSCLPDRKER